MGFGARLEMRLSQNEVIEAFYEFQEQANPPIHVRKSKDLPAHLAMPFTGFIERLLSDKVISYSVYRKLKVEIPAHI